MLDASYVERSSLLTRRVRVRRGGRCDALIVAALLVVVVGVTGWGLRLYPALSGDEGIYIEQARAILHGRLSPYTYTYDHPFLGWAQLSGLAWVAQRLRLGGSLSVVDVRVVMVLLQACNTVLVYGIARRLDMQRAFAAGAVLLFALSPLTVDLTRQVYLDNIAMPWLLLSFYLMLDRARRQWVFACAGAAFAVAVLSKETVVLFAPALAYLLLQRTSKKLRVMAGTVTAAMFTVLVSIYPLFALLRGELFPGRKHVSLWTNGIVYQLASRKGSGAVWTPGSAKEQLLRDWLSFDRVLIIGGLVAMVMILADRSRRWLGLALALAILPIVKPGGYLPSMYVVCTLPFAALAIAALVDRAWMARTQTKRAWLRLLVAQVTLAISGFGVGFIAPAYATGDKLANTADALTVSVRTRDFLASHVKVTDTVLTDDVFIVDLNRVGLTDPWNQVVSYYKYDLDPTARKKLPRGYRDLTYVVVTPQMRADIKSAGLHYTQDAVLHSIVVAVYGQGDSRIEVRKVAR